MIPKEIVDKINEALPVCPYNTSGMSVYMDWVVYKENVLKQRQLVIDGYTLAQKSIQDEAIAFAKWMSERPITSFWLRSNDEQIKYYQQFKTEQDG